MCQMFRCPGCKEISHRGHRRTQRNHYVLRALCVLRWLSIHMKTSDPDFPEAKRAVKKALILWLVLTVAHIAVMAKMS